MRSSFPFFWQPNDVVPSLADLPVTGGVTAKKDLTFAVTGQNSERHPLIVAELADGKVIGDLRLVATADDVVIGGLQSLFGCAKPESHYLMHRWRFRIPKYRHGTALLLGAANSDNYYHWLLDSLPRWKLLEAAGYADFDHVLLHSEPRGFQDETLDRLEVPAAKRLRCSKKFVHQFERLVVPAMPFPVEEVPDWACAWLRSLFLQKTVSPEKVYLTRGAGGRRVLRNEGELQTNLERLGFVSIQTAELTVAEQAKLVSSARCVVAPHGAALTNMIFAPPGAMLLELFHPEHKNRCYFNLASSCGHNYASLDGHAINRPGERMLEYTIDIPAVLKTIRDEI